MNPYSRSLIKRLLSKRDQSRRGQPSLVDQDLAEFVDRWDRLEVLVIQVYKSRIVSAEDESEHREVFDWLRQRYPEWQPVFEPYWLATKIAGKPTTDDPFLFLLSHQGAGEFVRNSQAMKTLPAAREALNQLLIARLG